jgi:3-dehydroquinate dehydratase I
MEQLKIGSVILGSVPRVVAIVDEFLDSHRIAALAKTGADILEIRFDLLGDDIPSLCVFVDKIKKTTGYSCIGTIRETEGNRHKRMDMFKAIIPFVDAVDIEIDASIARQVTAHAAGKTVIVSDHDFEKTPDAAHLHGIVGRALDLGAHIVKIAATAHSRHDVARLLSFAETCAAPVVIIAMGEVGVVSRVAAPVFGSLFTYGYLRSAVAPGQLRIDKLVEEMRMLYPSMAAAVEKK